MSAKKDRDKRKQRRRARFVWQKNTIIIRREQEATR